MAYDNELSGVLFKAGEKKNEKAPDYKGQAQVGGKRYWIAGWKKKSKKGADFLSLRLTADDKAASEYDYGW